jgi:hypothetical protein
VEIRMIIMERAAGRVKQSWREGGLEVIAAPRVIC